MRTPRIAVLLVLLMTSVGSGCATRVLDLGRRCPASVDLLPEAGPSLLKRHSRAAADGNYVAVDFFYGTNRQRTRDCHPDRLYGFHTGELELGRVRVTLPRAHEIGSLETPSIWRLELDKDPSSHVVVTSVQPLWPGAFHRQLADAVAASSGREAFVFVHGFNVPFEEAARRSAQVAYDLKFRGAPILFSWPSEGRVTSYLRDREVAEASGPALASFLSEITRRSGATTIHLIAHSMGAHVLGAALRELIPAVGPTKPRFQEIVLAAPDLDARSFEEDLAEVLTSSGQRVTLYASARDRALQIARDVISFPRVGDTASGIIIHDRIETVDATAVDTSFVGHSYYGDNKSVMFDLFHLLHERRSANDRFGLESVVTARGTYWRFRR